MKIYVVGIGPGSLDHMTPYAKAAIEKCGASKRADKRQGSSVYTYEKRGG